MSKEKELLWRCLRRFHKSEYECTQLVEDIKKCLDGPAKKLKPLSEEEIWNLWESLDNQFLPETLIVFARAIEKHHSRGIEE